MRSRKSTDEQRDSSNGLANYTEQNRKIMFDISPRKKNKSANGQKELNGSPTENNNKRVGLLQPLKLLQEQIQKRQQKVQDSIEEHKKITSSNQIQKSSQKIVGNDKLMNSATQFFGSNVLKNLSSANNSQNAAQRMSSPSSSFKLGISSPSKNQTSTIAEEPDSIMSNDSLCNNKHEIKSKNTKKLQNIFRVITLMNKKMKIKKKDKDTVFFNRYIKEYENVDTYFNVKQVFQQLNPLNNLTPSIIKGDRQDTKSNDYSQEINEKFQNQTEDLLIEDNEEGKNSSSSDEEEIRKSESIDSYKGAKSSSLNSQTQQQQPKGMSLLKRLFQKNNNQSLQISPKRSSESKFAQKNIQKKIEREELNTQYLIKLLQNLQNSYQIEENKVKEDEEENQDDLFYDNLHKQLIKALSQEPNGHEKSKSQLDFWQERELETINFQIKKAHEHNRKIRDMRNLHDQSLIQNKYLEFKKKSDQALKLLKKGGYKIYRSKLKQIEEQEKRNKHIMETIERFKQFDQSITYKPIHHQHFSHKSIGSQKQISAVFDNQTEIKKKSSLIADKMMQEFMQKNRKSIVYQSLPYSGSSKNTPQNLNKSYTLNFSRTIQLFQENDSTQKNDESFQLNKENLPFINKRRSSLTSNQSKLSSQYSICQSKINPRKATVFKDLQQSLSYSKQTIESKLTQKSIQEIFLTDQKIIEENEKKQPQEFKKQVSPLDISLINEQIKDDYIIKKNNQNIYQKISNPSSKEKKSSNKIVQINEEILQPKRNMFLSTNLSPKFNQTHHSNSKSFQKNFSPFNKKSNLKKLNSFAVNTSPQNQNQKETIFSTISHKKSSINQSHQRRNTIMNVFALNKKQPSVVSQFSNQQSPKNNIVHEENIPMISSFGQSPKPAQIENIKQQEDTIQFLRRRSSIQHKTVIIASPSQIQRKIKRINTVHFQKKDQQQPQASNFSKEMAAYKLQEQYKNSPQLIKAKSLISQIFKRPDKNQIPQIKEKEFFPQLDFYRQKSFHNLEDTYYQSHNSFCTAVEKRNKRILNQYSLLKQNVSGNSQSLSETPTGRSQIYNSTSHSQNQKSNQLSTFYSSKSPLILLKDQLRKVSAFQQKYSNKVQTLLYDLDFAQEENTFVKSQMIRTVNDSYKSFEQITSQISPQLECIRDLFEQSTQDTQNKKPFIQKASVLKKS
ncbi:hypothetical protein ABPG72_016192 [Tetrahymena utriculariae]